MIVKVDARKNEKEGAAIIAAPVHLSKPVLQPIHQAEGDFFRCKNIAPTEGCRPVGVEYRGRSMAAWDRMPPHSRNHPLGTRSSDTWFSSFEIVLVFEQV
jgi:hypothetical protein